MTPTERERLFVQIFEEHHARLLRLCSGYVDSRSDADDLFQEVMTNVWNGLPGFRGASAVTTWVYRIAVNTALMHRRKRRPETTVFDETANTIPAPAAADPSDEQRLEALRRAITRLGATDRLCIGLLLEGLSYKEIAEITGMSLTYVGVRLSRAKRQLGDMLRGDAGL